MRLRAIALISFACLLLGCGDDDLAGIPAPIDASASDVRDASTAPHDADRPDAHDAADVVDTSLRDALDARDASADGDDVGLSDGTVDAPLTSGARDPAFAIACDGAPGVPSDARALVVLPDDSIVALGGSTRTVLTRRTATDLAVSTYGVNGWVVLAHGAHDDEPVGLVARPDGGVLVVTNTDANGAHPSVSFAIVSADGVQNLAYGNGGFLAAPIGADAIANAILPVDGGVLVGGFEIVDTRHLAFLARFTLDGAIDPTFGTNGVTTFTYGLDPSTPNIKTSVSAIALRGVLVLAAGLAYDPARSTQLGTGVSCFTPDGFIDSTFGQNGAAYTGLVAGDAPNVANMATRDDGELLLVGSTSHPGFFEGLLDGSGAIDLTFGGVGERLVGDGGGAFAVLVRDDGAAIVGGAAQGGGFRLDRILPNGDADATFGDGGTVITRPLDAGGFPGLASLVALAHQSNGRILALGGPQQICLAGYVP